MIIKGHPGQNMKFRLLDRQIEEIECGAIITMNKTTKKWLVTIRVTDDCNPEPLEKKYIEDMVKQDIAGHESGIAVEVIKIEEEE